MRQFQVAEAYADVSRQLGLDVDTRGLSLQGYIAKQRVWIGTVMVGHGPERKEVNWGVMDLPRPMAMGVLVRRRGLAARMLRRSGAPSGTTGDAELDRLFEIQGDSPDHTRALFTPKVRAALNLLVERWKEVAITDRGVRVYLARAENTPGRLRDLVDAMYRLTRLLDEARASLPAPERLANLNDEWLALIQSHGLELDRTGPTAHGIIQGTQVQITPRRTATGYDATLRMWFPTPGKTGIQIRPQTRPDGYWSVGQDIQVGRDQFDDAFVIKGWDPERIRIMLDESARAALIAIAEHGQPEIDDQRLCVQGLPLCTSTIQQVLNDATKLAIALGFTDKT